MHGLALLKICRHELSGHSVRQDALTSVVCGFTAGGSGILSTATISNIALSAHIVQQTNFVPTGDYANKL